MRVFSILGLVTVLIAVATLTDGVLTGAMEVWQTSCQAPRRSASRSAPADLAAADSTIIHNPVLQDDQPRDLPGLHNVVAFYQGFWSGSVPEVDAGFDTLQAMGVKTIISVDGAEPEVELARARGMRYIHLPVGYNGFEEQRRLQLARATRDAMRDGAVYIHCHHGKHRSAGAAGAVVATLGWLSPAEATARMQVSGTAADYKGLYACTAKATAVDAEAIDAVPATFPEVAHPPTFVRTMLEIDEINDRLKLIEKVGWTVPRDHPDLVPAAEAGRMADLFRMLAASEKARAQPEDFAASLKLDGEGMTTLEAMIVAGERDLRKISEQFKLIQTSCQDCHTTYRD
jgi:hypothetical protein